MVALKKSLIIMLALTVVISLSTVALADEVTLKWWSSATVTQQEVLKEAIKKFEETHPGVKVELTVINGWTDLWRKMVTAVAAGEPPNVARVKDFMVQDLAQRGALLDVSSYYEKDKAGVEADDYFEKLLQPFWIDGGLYAFPWHVYYYVMYYNKDLLEKAGYTDPPETWEELIEMSKKIANPDKNVYGTQMMTYSGNDAFMAKVTEMWARQQSDNPQSDPWDVNAEIPVFNLTSDSMKKGLQMWLDMIYEEKIALPPELSTMPQRTQNGLIAFWFSSAIGASELNRATQLNFDLALMPKAKSHTSIVEVNAFVPFANTGDDDLTWELLKFATGPEVDLMWSKDGVYLPVRQTYWEQEPFNSNPYYLLARKQLEHSDTVFHSNYTRDWLSVMTSISEELEKIYYKQISIDEGLAAAQEKVDKLMKEMYGDAYKK